MGSRQTVSSLGVVVTLGGNTLGLVILDLDGVLYTDDGLVPGSPEAVKTLRDNGVMVRVLTNDAVASRATRCAQLGACGFLPGEVYTAASLTADRLRLEGGPETMLLMGGGDAVAEFVDIPLVTRRPKVVVIGDFFATYDYDLLNEAFNAVRSGASLIAMQRNRCCFTGQRTSIDVGFWVAGLEYCAGVDAIVVGKPSAESYLRVCRDVGCLPQDAAMLSDDATSDLYGAHKVGLQTVCIGHPGGPAPYEPDLTINSWTDIISCVNPSIC